MSLILQYYYSKGLLLKIYFPAHLDLLIHDLLLYFAIFASVFYVFAGGVYDFVEEPISRGADSNGNPILIYPDRDRQFLIEGIVAAIIMFLGAGGLYMINQATTDPHNPQRASSYQALEMFHHWE